MDINIYIPRCPDTPRDAFGFAEQFELGISKRISVNALSANLGSINLWPSLVNPNRGITPEHIEYERASNSVFSYVNMDFVRYFRASSDTEKINLLMVALCRAATNLPSKRLPDQDKQQLTDVIFDTGVELGASLDRQQLNDEMQNSSQPATQDEYIAPEFSFIVRIENSLSQPIDGKDSIISKLQLIFDPELIFSGLEFGEQVISVFFEANDKDTALEKLIAEVRPFVHKSSVHIGMLDEAQQGVNVLYPEDNRTWALDEFLFGSKAVK